MATDYSLSILIDSTVSDKDKLEIVKRIYAAVQHKTVVPTHAASHTAGSRADQHTLTIT